MAWEKKPRTLFSLCTLWHFASHIYEYDHLHIPPPQVKCRGYTHDLRAGLHTWPVSQVPDHRVGKGFERHKAKFLVLS